MHNGYLGTDYLGISGRIDAEKNVMEWVVASRSHVYQIRIKQQQMIHQKGSQILAEVGMEKYDTENTVQRSKTY